MKSRSATCCLGGLIAAVLLSGAVARGAGFALYEMGARGFALGGGLVGMTGDASANYYNPANLTALPGAQAMAGGSLIYPRVTVQTVVPGPDGPETVETDNEKHGWFAPHAYGSLQVSERAWIGIGIYSPFGLGSTFDDEWVGRYNSYKAIFESIAVNPNLACRVTDKLSVAAGLQIVRIDIQLKRKLPNPLVAGGPDLDFDLEGDSVGYGGNGALSYAFNDHLGLGLVYRSEVHQTVKGDATLRAGDLEAGADAEGDAILPASTTAGVNYRRGRLNLGVAVTWTEWSSFDELRVTFANPALVGTSESATPKDWRDVWRYGLGAEYAMTHRLSLRCSYVFDEDPVPDRTADYLFPADDRHLFGVGVGWRGDRYWLDLGYTYLMMEERNDIAARPAEGFLQSSFKDEDAHILSVSLGGEF